MKPRSRTPEPPYCWQSKTARRHIREKMNGHESTSSLLSLYDAMTEEASNQGSEVFKAGQPYLGELSGLSAKSVQRLERLLEEFGVVRIERLKLHGHHTYTLLAFGQGVSTLGQDDLTLGHGRFRGSCPPVEVTSEVTAEVTTELTNSSNGSKNRPNRRSSGRIQLVDDEHIAKLKAIFQPRDADKAVANLKAWLLTPKGKGKPSRKRVYKNSSVTRSLSPQSRGKRRNGK
jgi:hypothetical protein